MKLYRITHTNNVRAFSVQHAINEYKKKLSKCNSEYSTDMDALDYFDAGLVRVELVENLDERNDK